MKQVAVFVVLPIAFVVAILLADEMIPSYYVSDVPSVDIPDIQNFKKAAFSRCSLNEFAFFKKDTTDLAKKERRLNLHLESIFISQNTKYCYINGRVFKEGESGEGFRILRIYKDGVLIRTKYGNIRVGMNVEATQKN